MMNSMALSRRKRRKAEISALETAVFGGKEDVIQSPGTEQKVTKKLEKKSKTKKRKPAWIDEEEKNIKLQDMHFICNKKYAEHLDLQTNYKEYLQSRFTTLRDTPEWAKLENKRQKEDPDDLFGKTHAGKLFDKRKSCHLKQTYLEFKRCRDVNSDSNAEGSVLTTVEFHPTSSVAVVAGKTGIASLFQIDGKKNPKIQTIVFKNFPIHTSHFSVSGEEFIVGSSDYGFFYYYDMMAGKVVRVPWKKDLEQRNMQDFSVSPDGNILAFLGNYGYIHLLTASTKEWISSLKMNNNVATLAFNKDGSRLYSYGDAGEVYVWDMNTRDCIHKFYDEGSIGGTAIALSPNGQYMAAGSDSGVVNVYDTSNLLKSASPKPDKVIYNITTAVTGAKFNHTSELLVLTSRHKENAIKLVHFPSATVFCNFPGDRINLKKPICADISINSGYFAIANNTGAAFLYRLKHFDNF